MEPGTVYLFRSTTDKLADHLNHITECGDSVVGQHFVGGRDWVIVCRKDGRPVVERDGTVVRRFAGTETQVL
jgi:hypothetical protein